MTPAERTLVYQAVAKALRHGRLTRQPCAHCGAGRVQGHHDDYTKPLDVIWLCVACHRQLHGKRPSAPPRPYRSIRRGVMVRNLRQWRERRALSQQDLADKAGIRQATVWHIEKSGVARPSTVRKLAAALGVEIEALIGETQQA